MLDCNLDFRIAGGSRVPTLMQFLRTTAQEPTGAACVARVIERVCDPRDYIDDVDKHAAVVEHMNKMLRADGYEVAEVGGRWVLRERGAASLVVGQVTAKAAVFDFNTVNRDVERALASAERDPEDAVTAACSMLEAVCRSIVAELSLDLPARRDIDGLIKAVQDTLGLKPGRADLPLEIANDVRQVLGGLTNAAAGIGALRAHAGDAHGREKNFARIDSRIARLASPRGRV